MKKITLTLFFTLGLFILCNAQELVNNTHEGFDIGTGGNTDPMFYQASGGSSSVQVGTLGTLGDGGNQVLKAIHAAGQNNLNLRSKNLQVKEGDVFVVTAKVGASNGAYITTMRYTISDSNTGALANAPDSPMTISDGVLDPVINGKVTGATGSGTISCTFTAPAGFNNCRVQFYNYGAASTFELDDLVITKVPALSINDLSKFSFSSYPNPAKNYLNLSAAKSINKIEIYNLLGQNVLNKTINSNKSDVNVSNLSKGIYVARVFIDNTVGSYKFIKE